MKKILLLGCTIVLVLSLVLLGGCAGNDDTLTDDPAAGQQQDIQQDGADDGADDVQQGDQQDTQPQDDADDGDTQGSLQP